MSDARSGTPSRGFGRMWQKTYRVRLPAAAASPAGLMAAWKARLAVFWPHGSRAWAPLTAVKPGELDRLGEARRTPLSTGVVVVHDDDTSLTLVMPPGHPVAAWITLSAASDGGETVAQAQVLMSAAGPLAELALGLGGHARDERFWRRTLSRLAAHCGVEAAVETQVVCVDRHRRWSRPRLHPTAAS
jgi:hypothetical protein